MKKYKTIIADPPWQYSNTGVEASAGKQYQTMSVEKICAMPVKKLADNDCVLFLWATWPQLQIAMRVINAWGFEYITGLPWIKIRGRPLIDLWGKVEIKPQYGTGFWVRGCSEPILICRRGKPKATTGNFCGLISPNFQHSRKPESLYEMAEMCEPSYLELFARRQRDGWDVFGDEVKNSIIM